VDLAAHADRYPHELSGGERQRVALARALAPNPRVVLMDEPFSGLDERLRDRVRRDTLALLRDTETTAVIVTHSPREAASAGDRIALLRRGRLLQCGSAEDLYNRPQTAFTARFFGELNEFGAVAAGGRVDTPLGSFAAPHLADGSRARVCIRPEHLRVARGETHLKARVVAAEFEGDVDRVTLKVEGVGTPLLLRTFGRAPIRHGHPVYLDLDSSDVVVVPDDES
jgi:iron(III) transport system ATP-binding protein